ncbi:hypothetical protein RI129_004587 [Pyrocoelia pectoralis]|uniref:Cytochrome P450 n=1 Tax=Pyrocoelia pectoralis TaxID=417401 RepID=A0AAN7VH80_9COLE
MMLWFLQFVLYVLGSVILYQKWRHRHFSKIPGPPSWPLVGHTLQSLGSPEHRWKYIQQLNTQYYPIFKISNGFTPYVNLLDPHDIEILLSSRNHIRKSTIYVFLQSWLGTGLLTSDGDKWHRRRKMLTPAFYFNIIQQFFKCFVEHSEQLVERLQEECAKPYTNIPPLISQIGQLIMNRIERPWLFLNCIYQFTAMNKEQNLLINTLHKFSKSVIENRKQCFVASDLRVDSNDGQFGSKKRLAMLDLLLTLKNSGVQISDEGIREEVDTFMFEGHDTTSAGISFALILIANHPNVQEKLVEEIQSVMNGSDRSFLFSDIQQMHYLELVVKECLRLYPSVPSITRKTDYDIVTSTGYLIPKDTIVIIHIYALHHNPKFYPNPEKFDPDRFLPENTKGRHPFSYIPFSAGPRNCIGQKFAMVEMKTAIASIIRNFVLKPIDNTANLTLISRMILNASGCMRIQFRKR